jgi:hypothetical protein
VDRFKGRFRVVENDSSKANPNSSQKTRWDLYTTAGRKREARSPRVWVGGTIVAKSTMITIVIPSHLIRCKTVVSTTVVRTQGLGAP